jgi:hypothetical protein
VNAPANPYYAGGGNHPHAIPDTANALARSLGMEWGGGWSTPKDYMHFEIHLTPAQVHTVAGRLSGAPVPVPAPSGGDLSAQFEADARARWHAEDLLDHDLRADLHVKQLQLDQLVADMATLKAQIAGLAARQA